MGDVPSTYVHVRARASIGFPRGKKKGRDLRTRWELTRRREEQSYYPRGARVDILSIVKVAL